MKVIQHLKARLRDIEASISRLKFQLKMLEETKQKKEEALFAHKVEHQALQHTLNEWIYEE